MLSCASAKIVSITAILQGKPVTAQALWRLQPLSGHIHLPRPGSEQVPVRSSVWCDSLHRLHQKCPHNALLYRLQGTSLCDWSTSSCPDSCFSHFSSLLFLTHCWAAFLPFHSVYLEMSHSGCEAQLCPALCWLKLTMFRAGQPGISSQRLHGRPQPHQVHSVQTSKLIMILLSLWLIFEDTWL